MTAGELDDAYTRLCHGLTAAGEAATAQVLARLVLLLMSGCSDAAAVRRAIDDALVGFEPASADAAAGAPTAGSAA